MTLKNRLAGLRCGELGTKDKGQGFLSLVPAGEGAGQVAGRDGLGEGLGTKDILPFREVSVSLVPNLKRPCLPSVILSQKKIAPAHL